jgi:leader peptidase (prepilin peptidase)/N-methyltransferase
VGAAAGSFLNVVVWRVPRGESVVAPPSHCPSCGARIRPRDNIPIVSWLILRGRCRSCEAPISARYPLVEALTAVLFAAIVAARGLETDLVWQLPLAAGLVAIAAIDLDHRIIPNAILIPLAVWGAGSAAIVRTGDLPELLAWGAGAFAFFLVTVLAYPAGMGMGDVKLAGVIGLYLGSSVVPALFAAFLSGALVGVAIMFREGFGARKQGVPFGPFLAGGAILGLLAGPEIVHWYRTTGL